MEPCFHHGSELSFPGAKVGEILRPVYVWATDGVYLFDPTRIGGWLPEPLEGDWTLEDLEDAAMYEEILWPRSKVQIWGDMYYALFRDGDVYFTLQD